MNIKKKISLICFSAMAGAMMINMTSCADKVVEGKLSVTPVPSEVKWQNGVFKLNPSTTFTVDATEVDKNNLTSYLLASPLKIKSSEAENGDNRIVLKVVPSLEGITSAEGYRLSVDGKGVKIEALSGAGLFYGVQTLLQMAAESLEIPFIEIKDEPRFQYRGMMLDVSRHFFDKDFVKKQIDLLAYYKINRLHLHLTDAAGWRLEIKKYPRLTEFAAWRPQAVWKDWWTGDRKYCEQSDPRAQGGYYTQDEMRELVEYAAQKYITIIPEIEMPAHSEEVLTAYPELSCTHVPYKQADFCVGNEKVFEFLENVLLEVMEIFPSEYIHIGGDEAGKASWKTCKLCQARMKKEGLKDVNELQSYMIHRMERFLNSHGRNLLGWDEILEGGLAPNATVMSWRGTEGGIKAVKAGQKTIMSPGQYCYLDEQGL